MGTRRPEGSATDACCFCRQFRFVGSRGGYNVHRDWRHCLRDGFPWLLWGTEGKRLYVTDGKPVVE